MQIRLRVDDVLDAASALSIDEPVIRAFSQQYAGSMAVDLDGTVSGSVDDSALDVPGDGQQGAVGVSMVPCTALRQVGLRGSEIVAIRRFIHQRQKNDHGCTRKSSCACSTCEAAKGERRDERRRRAVSCEDVFLDARQAVTASTQQLTGFDALSLVPMARRTCG